MAQGDFGPSFRYRDFTVNDILAESLPISALLGTVAMMWALALGISTGIASALRPGSRLDLTLRVAATAGIALPNFVIAGFLVEYDGAEFRRFENEKRTYPF